MEWGVGLTLWPVTVSVTIADFPYFVCRAPNELDHHFKSPISINFLRL